MKKLLSLITITSLLATAPIALAEDDITVTIDGNPVEFDVPPMIINDRTMVPMRAIFESLGAIVEWNSDTKTALGSLSGIVVNFPVDRYTMLKNTIELDLDTPATIIDGRTLLPVRAVAESFGMNVDWNGNTRTVSIDSSNNLGSYTTDSGLVYKGELQNDIPNGYGTFFNNGNPIFMGITCNSQLVKGSYFYNDGSKYFGEFSSNLPNGDGQKFYDNGDIYIGAFQDGLPDGWGSYYWTDGEYYTGGWSKGQYNGFGTFYDAYGLEKSSGYLYNGKTAQDAYAAEKQLLDEEYKDKLSEIYDLQLELYELQNTDPYSTEEAKSILGKYDMSTSSSIQGANGGNVDSYSAANAMRQQAALYAQAQETVLKAYNAKIKNMQDSIDNLQQLADDWYDSELKALKIKYSID